MSGLAYGCSLLLSRSLPFLSFLCLVTHKHTKTKNNKRLCLLCLLKYLGQYNVNLREIVKFTKKPIILDYATYLIHVCHQFCLHIKCFGEYASSCAAQYSVSGAYKVVYKFNPQCSQLNHFTLDGAYISQYVWTGLWRTVYNRNNFRPPSNFCWQLDIISTRTFCATLCFTRTKRVTRYWHSCLVISLCVIPNSRPLPFCTNVAYENGQV